MRAVRAVIWKLFRRLSGHRHGELSELVHGDTCNWRGETAVAAEQRRQRIAYLGKLYAERSRRHRERSHLTRAMQALRLENLREDFGKGGG